jgi:hypothetical protein
VNLSDLEVVKQLLDMAADRNVVLTRVSSAPGPDSAGWTVEFAAPPAPDPVSLPQPVELPAQPWQPTPIQPRVQHHSITHPSLWTNGQPPSFLKPIKDQ